ncbi:hypothetical protein E4U21_005260 [Claviceps maximensis]|nr:hypothetical protein E4U21_005260 [Claviceps maximensis]
MIATKAIVIGGGPSGVAAALRLQQVTDISVTVYELYPGPRTLGGSLVTAPNGMRLFHRLGVHQDLVSRGSSNALFTIRSLNNGVLASYDLVAGVIGRNGGFGILAIKRTELVRVLLEAADKVRIPIHYGKKLIKVEERDNAVHVTFADGTTDQADILLGCDGIHSAVRKQFVDPEQEPEYTGLSSIACVIPRPGDLPETMASQLRGISGTLTTTGALGVFSCSPDAEHIFWGMSKEVAPPAEGDTRDGWEVRRAEEVAVFQQNMLQMLKGARSQWADIMRVLVTKTESVSFYPNYKLPRGRRWHRGRCVLVGDAAHATRPRAGQGVSQALEDVFLLSRLLQDPGRPLQEVFAVYDKIRRPRVEAISKEADENSMERMGTSAVALWVKEWAVWAYFAGARIIGYQTTAATDKQMLYDIDEEVI